MTEHFTENVFIEGSEDAPQLRVQAYAVQTDPLQTWEADGDTVLAQVTGDGRIQVGDDLSTPDSLLEAHRDDNVSSGKPNRGLHSLGRITNLLTDVISWAVAELELIGSNGVSGLQSALRVKLTHNNTGDSTDAELRTVDVEAINQTGTSGAPLDHLAPFHATLRNEAGAYLNEAAVVEAKLVNAGTIQEVAIFDVEIPSAENTGTIETLIGLRIPDITEGSTDNLAIQTGQGKVEFADEVTAETLKVNGTGGNGFVEVVAQSSVPGAPASGWRLFADAVNRFVIKFANGKKWTFAEPPTADRTYTFPDATGNVILDTATQNLSNKTITASSLVATALSILIGGFKAIFTHSNTADRTYTFPDASGTVALTSNIPSVPLTTKGDLLTYDTANARLGVGTDNQILVADSSQSKGIKWALVSLVNSITGILGVANGGTGKSSLGAHNLLVGNGTSAVNELAPGASGNFVISDGTDWISRPFTPSDIPNSDDDAGIFFFGDGSDGNLTASSGTTTLTRDTYYNNVTLSGTAKIDTGGYRLFIAGTLDISNAGAGAIFRNGGNGGAGASSFGGGNGGNGGGQGAGTTGVTVGSSGTGGGGGGGGTFNGQGATAGGPGGGISPSNGGAGNTGGAGESGGGAGAAGGTGNPLSIRRFAVDILRGVVMLGGGGAGGGGGGGSVSGTAGGCGGGGGGGGGGVLWISAKIINRGASTPVGCIQAKGGNGGAGGGAGGRGGGGGGGGGGGWIYLAYGSLAGATATNALDASGGNGGSGGTGSAVGGDGGAGGRITVIDIANSTSTETVGSAGSQNSGSSGGAGNTLRVSL